MIQYEPSRATTIPGHLRRFLVTVDQSAAQARQTPLTFSG
jgi:hypothetical protein